jgi:3-deoxy-D-manno-octulosonic-acid transferase
VGPARRPEPDRGQRGGLPGDRRPHTFNFKAVCEQAIEVGAAVRADDIDDGLQVALEIIADPIRRKAMGEAGSLFAHSHRGATGAPWT